MESNLINLPNMAFKWEALFDPTEGKLVAIGEKYGLHPELIKDCMQEHHLPKYERMDNYSFVIFRYLSKSDAGKGENVARLTRQIAIFYSQDFIVSIHREQPGFFEFLQDIYSGSEITQSREFLNFIIGWALFTYEQPVNDLIEKIDALEKIVFLNQRRNSLLEDLYHQKRKADVLHRLLILSFDVIDAIDSRQEGTVNTRDTRDLYMKLRHMLESVLDNIPHLLSIYFSSASQRTNENMRILTIFSVFFMPLSFIAGIYGMNFKFMPELSWKTGYPGAIGLMLLTAAVTYLWFKKKKWL